MKKLTDGIIKSLSQSFEGYSIYTEDVEQDLDPPCFLVLLNESKCNRFRGDTFNFEADYTIHFFPQSSEPRRECGIVSGDLQLALSTVPFGEGELIDATKIKAAIESDRMTANVSYNKYLRMENSESVPIGQYSMNVTVKE